jgi:hypothetical protein
MATSGPRSPTHLGGPQTNTPQEGYPVPSTPGATNMLHPRTDSVSPSKSATPDPRPHSPGRAFNPVKNQIETAWGGVMESQAFTPGRTSSAHHQPLQEPKHKRPEEANIASLRKDVPKQTPSEVEGSQRLGAALPWPRILHAPSTGPSPQPAALLCQFCSIKAERSQGHPRQRQSHAISEPLPTDAALCTPAHQVPGTR